jgi:hypothetical protein
MGFSVLFLISEFAFCSGLRVGAPFAKGCCVGVVLFFLVFLVIIIRVLVLAILDVIIVIISAIWS